MIECHSCAYNGDNRQPGCTDSVAEQLPDCQEKRSRLSKHQAYKNARLTEPGIFSGSAILRRPYLKVKGPFLKLSQCSAYLFQQRGSSPKKLSLADADPLHPPHANLYSQLPHFPFNNDREERKRSSRSFSNQIFFKSPFLASATNIGK